MSSRSTVKSLRQARRMFKGLMNYHPEGMEDWRDGSRKAVKRVLEQRMRQRIRSYLEEELSKGIQDRRNGAYRRQLLTSLGAIELMVPRTRHFNPVEIVQAYARRSQDVDRCILACFVFGLSTRKVAEALLPILGERVSASTVSQVAKALDTEVAAFHRRPLSNRYRVLQFDGVVLSRKTGVGALRRPVLVVLGITPDGRKEILDYQFARAESQEAWEGFLNTLYARGLTGEGLELITVDGGSGLLAALEVVFPGVAIQRCWAHKTRNILDKVRKADWEVVKRDLHAITHARNRSAGRKAAQRFINRWWQIYPKAVECLRKDFVELMAFFRFRDPAWRAMTRTTNSIERRFREVRRRTRPMGVFSDRTSMDRILYAVFSYENLKQGVATLFPLTQNS
jgi:putative transposase